MRLPQVVILEREGFLAWQLEELFRSSRWLLREVRNASGCLPLLQDTRPSVFVVEIEAESVESLTVVADVQAALPVIPMVAVGESARKDRRSVEDRIRLTRVLYELGARYVCFPPLSRELLCEVVRCLMNATIRRMGLTPEWFDRVAGEGGNA